MATYEFFDHTADIGMRVEAATLPELFETSVIAMGSLIVGNPGTIQPTDRRRLQVEGDDLAYLYFDFLNALLGLFELEAFVPVSAKVKVEGAYRLEAELDGERFDPSRHGQGHEVKAVTYHALEVTEVDGGYRAQVVFDI